MTVVEAGEASPPQPPLLYGEGERQRGNPPGTAGNPSEVLACAPFLPLFVQVHLGPVGDLAAEMPEEDDHGYEEGGGARWVAGGWRSPSPYRRGGWGG
jgi:hypothetical protein